ncbi:histidine phosphatase family protein [Candidatus Micrarchaeota archaeon]|nr:histidine phosphatase family protein [Candidatus Micrarchaeota archaeon]
MTTIIFVRHGTSVNNEEGRWNSTLEKDRGLSEKGRKQAALLAGRLASEKIEAIYSSPFPRALQTAEAVNQAHGLKIFVDERLREMNKGVLDGLTKTEGRKKYWREYKQYLADRVNYRIPEAETHAEVTARTKQFIDDVTQRHSGTVLAATHEAVVQSAAAEVLNDDSYLTKTIPQATITRIKFSAKPALESFADGSHLGSK